MRLVPKRLKWFGLGAAVGWFLDPTLGPARRARVAEQAAKLVGRSDAPEPIRAVSADPGGAIATG
jgi:hypothetical protein